MIYRAKDTLTNDTVIVKLTWDNEMNFKEHQILYFLNQENEDNLKFPKIFGGGTISTESGQNLSFIILE